MSTYQGPIDLSNPSERFNADPLGGDVTNEEKAAIEHGADVANNVQITISGYPKLPKGPDQVNQCPQAPRVQVKNYDYSDLDMPFPGGNLLEDIPYVEGGTPTRKNQADSNMLRKFDADYDIERYEKAIRLNPDKMQYFRDWNQMVATRQMFMNVRRPKTCAVNARTNYENHVFGTSNLRDDYYMQPVDPKYRHPDYPVRNY